MYNLDLLTNDAKFLLSSMYKVYVEKRKSSESKENSMYFGDITDIHKNFMSQWKIDDVEFTCFELREHHLIDSEIGDDTLFGISLTTQAIALMEKTFLDKVDSVLDYATKIKNAIPFL